MKDELDIGRTVNAVGCEVARTVEEFGWQEHLSPAQYLAIITEELGEVARELNEHSLGNISAEAMRTRLEEELLHVAAMAVKMRIVLERKEA